MKTYILVANADEAHHLESFVQKNPHIQLMITGEGRSRVIATLAQCLKEGKITPDDRLINVGYVGAQGYKKGQVVIVKTVGHLFPSTTINEPRLCLEKGAAVDCYTADNFVNKDTFSMNAKGVIDMELYYIALMFPKVISIKIVSDELDYNDYKQANFEKAWAQVQKKIESIVQGKSCVSDQKVK